MSTTAQLRRASNYRRRYRKNHSQAAIKLSLAAHDMHKSDHDYDCHIYERKEWGCSSWGICTCGYGEVCKMHRDYSELRSLERSVAEVRAEVEAVFGKPDDGLAGGLESVSAAIAAELTDGHPPLSDSVKDALRKAEEFLAQRPSGFLALKSR